ncbi:hypothetical protein CPB86DRAFT_830181 [Serendipita vermifera]|nr:hypothetical protein CPB86DRAFT_830181 [Serendipita vermifera]
MRYLYLISTLFATLSKAATLNHVDTLAFSTSRSSLQLGGPRLAPTIWLDSNDCPGVIRAAGDVALDFGRVLGINGTVLLTNGASSSTRSAIIIAGTIGKSCLIDRLVSDRKIDISAIKGKWESYSSQVVSRPMAGVSSALVIAGSDKRGTIYGLYDISEQVGVSPWYWWADIPPKTKTGVWALPVTKIQGPPSIQYRGIFLNDEAPALSNWVRANYPDGQYGAGYNANFYSKVFELLLRPRANYLWPAMWDNTFYVDDSTSGPLADSYGIVMGTSHTEPLARATKEQHLFNNGVWDWSTDKENEVAAFYQQGMAVPDDITLLWTDDNVGNILRLPLSNETSRIGGAGMYYHFDYVGAPRNYKWINTIQLVKTWEQMHLAYERQAQKIWIVNVGDLKPLEIPITHFFDVAYNMKAFSSPDSTAKWLRVWAAGEFNPHIADATAAVITTYGKLISRRKYELLSTSPFALSVTNYDEAETVLQDWTTLLNTSQALYDSLDAATRTPFFEMVLHPILAGKTVQEIYIRTALGALYGKQQRTSSNVQSTRVIAAFQEDASITARYHGINNGKWNHKMDQPHIGYTTWSDPSANTLPNLTWVSGNSTPASGIMGVAIQGSDKTAPTTNHALIPVNPYMPPSDVRYLDIYTRANGTFTYNITSNASYISVSPSSGTLTSPGSSDVRAMISVDWNAAPSRVSNVTLTVASSSGTSTTAILPVNKTVVPPGFTGFVESNGAISIEAEHFTSQSSTSTASYMIIPDYGRTLSGVTLTPVTCPSQTTSSGPKLTYHVCAFTTNTKAKISVYLGGSFNFDPTRPLKYAFSLDEGPPTTVQPVPDAPLGTLPSGADNAEKINTWVSTSTISISAGSHTLDLWVLEPGSVIQKIVIDLGGVKSSYLGPPESKRV